MGQIYKKVKYYKRVILIVDADKAKNVLCEYQDKGYITRRLGPKVTTFPKCDPNRIKFVFEKEIPNPQNQER